MSTQTYFHPLQSAKFKAGMDKVRRNEQDKEAEAEFMCTKCWLPWPVSNRSVISGYCIGCTAYVR